MDSINKAYDTIIRDYVNNMIDNYAEQYVDVGDKNIWAYNAKLWARSEINNGSIGRIEQMI